MIVLTLLMLMIACISATPCFATENCRGGDCARCHTLTVTEARALLKEVAEVKDVALSPVKGLWQVTLEREGRTAVAFMNFGKSYILPGPLFPMAPAASGNQPAPKAKPVEKVDVSLIPLADSVVMGDPQGKKRLFVFTDPDCPFCRKLHAELKKLLVLEPDLAIYVKLFPLKMHPKAYDTSRVLLGAGTVELLDRAFGGGELPAPGEKDRAEPVDSTIKLAGKLGITGTPTMVLTDGTLVVGFRDAVVMQKMLAQPPQPPQPPAVKP